MVLNLGYTINTFTCWASLFIPDLVLLSYYFIPGEELHYKIHKKQAMWNKIGQAQLHLHYKTMKLLNADR